MFMLFTQGCNSELLHYIRESFSTAVLAHLQSSFNFFHLKMAENQTFEIENPILPKNNFPVLRTFNYGFFWFFFLYWCVFPFGYVSDFANSNWPCGKEYG